MTTVASIASVARPAVRGWQLCCPVCVSRDVAWRGEVLRCEGCGQVLTAGELARCRRDDSVGRMP